MKYKRILWVLVVVGVVALGFHLKGVYDRVGHHQFFGEFHDRY